MDSCVLEEENEAFSNGYLSLVVFAGWEVGGLRISEVHP